MKTKFGIKSFAASICLLAVAELAKGIPPSGTNNFHPVLLDPFVSRPFSNYKPTEDWGWAMVPRGVTDFDGVPFRMFGRIDLTGMGAARDGRFYFARVGEIPVGRRATRLHLIHGASYDDPNDAPMASLLLHYESGTDRKIFIRYGVHVRNSYPTWETRRPGEVRQGDGIPILRDPRSLVIWNGNTRVDGSVMPLRLFKTTFENPRPADEIRGIELLSLFARANSTIVAITTEESATPNPSAVQSIEETDDIGLRREVLVRTLDETGERSMSNVVIKLSVAEGGRTYGFGTYKSDHRGQVLLDYPPGKFQNLRLSITHRDITPFILNVPSEQGDFGAEIQVRLKRRAAAQVAP